MGTLYELLELLHNNKIEEYQERLKSLSREEQILLDLHLRKVAMESKRNFLTKYPSIDKRHLKHFSEEAISAVKPYMTAVEYLKAMNKDNLDRIAIDSAEETLTYREFFGKIDDAARAFYENGVKKGSVVIGLMDTETAHENYVLYGVDMTGGAVSYVIPNTPTDEICYKVNSIDEEYDVDYFVISSGFFTSELEKSIYKNTAIKHIILIGDNKDKKDYRTIRWDDFIAASLDCQIPAVDKSPEDLLFMAKTGGTTGKPKEVMINGKSFNLIVHQCLNSSLDYNIGDKWLRMWPLFSATAAISGSHLPLCCGMINVFRNVSNPEDLIKIIIEERINHLTLIPILVEMIMNALGNTEVDLSFIKTMGVGGVAITESFEKRFYEFSAKHNLDIPLGYGWGCTEHSSTATMRTCKGDAEIGKVGAPGFDTIVSCFDPETLTELKYGEEGELCILSDTLMMGYYQEDELTKKTIRKHKDNNYWLHTGDLGYIDENGLVKVTGRMTRTYMVCTGNKFYPAQIEQVISLVEGVEQVVVGAIPDQEHVNCFIPCCFVMVNANYNPESVKENIEKLCEESLAPYSRPKHICIEDYFPLLASGKPDVQMLENNLMSRVKRTRLK